MGIEGARFEVVYELPCISTEGGSADFKKGKKMVVRVGW